MANQLGRRYVCEVCGTEALCTKAGGGELLCDSQSMKLVTPKTLPSSD